jgi:hypothetical protein
MNLDWDKTNRRGKMYSKSMAMLLYGLEFDKGEGSTGSEDLRPVNGVTPGIDVFRWYQQGNRLGGISQPPTRPRSHEITRSRKHKAVARRSEHTHEYD